MKFELARQSFIPILTPLFLAAVVAPFATQGNVFAAAAESGAPVSGSDLSGGWHYVRTPNPQGGPAAVSIMHTADTSKSDLEFAGLTIRCGDGGTQILIILLRAFPLRARPHVIFGRAGHETQFEGTIAPPGTAILVPGNAANLVEGLWQTQADLFVRVTDGPTSVSGVVALTGLQPAFKALVANCASQ